MVSTNNSDVRTRQVKRIVIFSVIIAIVSAVILVTLVVFRNTETMRTWTPMVLTVEFGLVIIMMWAIASSWIQEHDWNKALSRVAKADLAVTSCPDYWTMSSSPKGEVICTNTFTDPENPGVSYTIQGSSATPTTRTINLSSYDGYSVKEVCDLARTEVAAPWSAVNPMCSNKS
jgi:hypothetical protein